MTFSRLTQLMMPVCSELGLCAANTIDLARSSYEANQSQSQANRAGDIEGTVKRT